MKSLKKICIIISVLIFLCFEITYCQTSVIPKVYVQINNPNLFSTKDFNDMVKLIKGRLSKDFNEAWQACESNIGGLLYCYRDAFNQYKNLIQNQFNNKFVIHFDFTQDFLLYYITKGGHSKLNKANFPGNHSGSARPAPSPYNEITIYNVYAPQWSMIKFSKNTTKCSYEYIISDVSKYLCDNGMKSMDDYDLLKTYNWNISGTTSISIKNMIIHEMFHIVLVLASNKNLQSRFADEATVSDTVDLISPLSGGKGTYGYSYEFISWLLDNQSSITIPIPFRTVTQYIKDDFYNVDGINRKFNPQPTKDLKYDQKGYTLGGYLNYWDNTTVNDSRCTKMEKYVIPPKCCI